MSVGGPDGPLRIGVIGAGSIANKGHLPAYAACPDAEVVAIADPSEGVLQSTADAFGIARRFADFADLLAADDIDAVSICTPNFLHRDTAVAALRAGKHALVEKPLAMNAAEARDIVEAARASGRQCMTGFVTRFDAEAQAVKAHIEAGELGNVYYARARFLRRRGIPARGVFGQKGKQGGGALIDIGVHVLDLALWLMGGPCPVSVSAVTACRFGRRSDGVAPLGQWDTTTFDVEDFAAAFVRFENGAALALETAWAVNIADELDQQVSLFGDRGGADVYGAGVFSESHGSLENLAPAVGRRDAFRAEIGAFVGAVKSGTAVPVPAEEGLLVNQLVDAFYESAETGHEVALT